VALALLASAASAGVLQGTLRLKPSPRTPLDSPAALRGVTEAVIYVEKVAPEVERRLTGGRRFLFFRKERPPDVLNVVQRKRFEPRVAAAVVGTRVAFVNLDRVYHNVFSVSASRRFDLGKNAPGSRDTVEFGRSGVVNLHCDIHPEEQGYLVVTPNHAYARPDSLGRWRLPKLPAGRYTVRMFHPTRGELTREVVMPARGDVTLQLVR
jgi:hypothetical protein